MSGPQAGPGALDGLRVLDLTRYIPGPYCTLLLADLGADVVKIEQPPGGDPTRAVPPAVGEDGATHAALNRNKRSIVVDIKTEDGAGLLRRMAEQADVWVESFRPGVLARRGLGSEELLARNPRLVYCSMSGYGQQGPWRDRAGHDINYVSLGGLLGARREGDERPAIPGTQLADMTGGLLAAIGILAALQARERTGRGQLVDVSLLGSVLALMTVPATRLMAGGSLANELSGTYACYNVYRCRDGRSLSVGALEPKFWEALCQTLGRPELASRQWAGGDRRRETIQALADLFASKDRDEWLRELATLDACVEPVLELDETLAQEHVRGSIVEQRSGEARYRTLACPVGLAATPATTRRNAPALGAHTTEVLAELGCAPAEIEHLRASGAVA